MGSLERLKGKVAIVTGGAAGIGLAATRRFVSEGAMVMVVDIDQDRLGQAKQELGDSVDVRRCDVTVESDVRATMERVIAHFGRLDVVFANAGVGSFSPI